MRTMHGIPGLCKGIGLALLFVVGAAGCQELSPPPMPPISLVVTEPDGLPPIHLHVDDSWSMRGYVVAPGSRYRQVVEACVDKLITAGYDRSILRFSDMTVGKAAPVAVQALMMPTFYNGKETPLATLLDRLSGAGQTGRMVVIATDLVNSERNRGTQAFIESFRRAATVWPEVLLLGFRSAFRGTYFVETLPRDIDAFELQLDGSAPERSRPFYLLVLAPSRRSLEDFRKYVVAHLDPDVEFHASERPIEWPKIDLLPAGSFGNYRKAEPLPGRPASIGFIGAFVEDPNARVRGDRGMLRLRLSGSTRLVLRSPDDLGYEIARLRGKEWESAKAEITAKWAPPTSAGAPGAAELIVQYEVPRVSPYSWETYRVRVRPGRANIVAPSWVADWTIRDDRVPPSPVRAVRRGGTASDDDPAGQHIGSRTLNLALLIEAMLRGITEHVVISEQYLRLGRER